MTFPSRFTPRPVAAPRHNVISAQTYTCPELAPFTGRTGCLDAFAKPSVIAGNSTTPTHHAITPVGVSKRQSGAAKPSLLLLTLGLIAGLLLAFSTKPLSQSMALVMMCASALVAAVIVRYLEVQHQRGIDSQLPTEKPNFEPIPHNVPRDEMRYLFFSCVIYSRAESERILLSPVWLRQIRKWYVRLFHWLSPQTREYLGIR